jgi:hypothetical protein
MDKDFKAVKASGVDAYLKSLSANPMTRPLVAEMKNSLSNEKLMMEVEASQALLPKKPTAVGESWAVKVDNGQGTVKGIATLKKVDSTPEGDLATIQIKGKLIAISPKPGVKVTKIDISVTGIAKIYVATGQLVHYTTQFDGTIGMNVKGTAVTSKMKGTSGIIVKPPKVNAK